MAFSVKKEAIRKSCEEVGESCGAGAGTRSRMGKKKKKKEFKAISKRKSWVFWDFAQSALVVWVGRAPTATVKL